MYKLMKFSADWCRPCHQQAKLLEGFKDAEVVAIDVEEEEELAAKYGIRNLPTMILFDEAGNEVQRFTGLTQPEKISAYCNA